MRQTFLTFFCVAASLMLWLPAVAQQNGASDPISGTWSGDWGPTRFDRNPATVNLKRDGKVSTGNVELGLSAVAIRNGTFDATTSTLHMAAVAGGRGNQIIHYVADARL